MVGFWSHSQFHELGAVLGGNNYIGDVGSDRYISPRNIAIGLLYRYNVNTRYSVRAGLSLATLFENENKTNDINRFRRRYEFENKIQEAINYLTKDRTTLVIAHRLSTILNSNKIFVVEQGEVIDQGKHEAVSYTHLTLPTNREV